MTNRPLRVEFRLRPLREIEPWRAGDGSELPLGWFALTDGWYWITVGAQELFRYSRATLEEWSRKHADALWFTRMGGLPFVDDYVAQLRSDLLWMLPDIYAPVPARLARTLASDAWMRWKRNAEKAVAESLSKNDAINLLYDATRWLGKRHLDGEMVSSLELHCWSDGVQVHIAWDSHSRSEDGLPLWEASAGHHAMSPEEFRAAVRDFDARLVRRMADRVAIAQAAWPRPDVVLDPHLAEAQVASARWGQGALAATRQREPDDWDRVFAAIARIEALPQFTSGVDERLAW